MKFAPLLSLALLCNAACDGDWSIQLPSSSNSIQNDFEATISGSAGSVAINIDSNAGTITQGGRVTNVVSNFQIPWDDTTLYAFIGADSIGIMMGWAYCDGNQLTDVWIEDTTGQAGFTSPRVSGTCNIQQTPKSVNLVTNSRCYAIDTPSDIPTITGQNLKLAEGSPGSVVLAGDTYDLLPFATVDCATCKASNLDGGWIEIHAVMRSASNVCLGIFYLQIIPKNTIPLNYLNCFFSMVEDTEFQAQYQLAQNSPQTTTQAQATMTFALPPITTSQVPNASQAGPSATSAASSVASAIQTSLSGSGSAITRTDGGSISSGAFSSVSTSTTSTNSPTSTSNQASHTSIVGLLLFFSVFVVIGATR